MPKVFLSSALALLGLSAPALAMPFPPLADVSPGVTLVANGCGGGGHRNLNGRCVPNGYGYVAPAPGVVVGAPGVVVGAPGVVVGAPGVVVGPHPWHRCWWRAGVRVCN